MEIEDSQWLNAGEALISSVERPNHSQRSYDDVNQSKTRTHDKHLKRSNKLNVTNL